MWQKKYQQAAWESVRMCVVVGDETEVVSRNHLLKRPFIVPTFIHLAMLACSVAIVNEVQQMCRLNCVQPL